MHYNQGVKLKVRRKRSRKLLAAIGVLILLLVVSGAYIAVQHFRKPPLVPMPASLVIDLKFIFKVNL